MIFGKKAQSPEKAIYYLIFGFLLTFIFLFLMWNIRSASLLKLNIPSRLQVELFTQRFLSSPMCFLHTEDGIVTDIIDWDKFSNETLHKCYYVADIKENPNVKAFRLILVLNSYNLKKDISTENWNENLGYEKEQPRPVMVFYKDKVLVGDLTVEVQNVR